MKYNVDKYHLLVRKSGKVNLRIDIIDISKKQMWKTRGGSRRWTKGTGPPLKLNFQSFHENQVFILNFILPLL